MADPQDFEQHLTQPIGDLDELRALLPITRIGLYLDHAAAGVLPQTTVDAMTIRIRSAATHGIRHWNVWQKLVQRTRRLTAELVGSHEDEIAFGPNTSAGIGTIAEGFPWQAGNNVVLSSSEFPSNRFPWLNLKRRDVEVRQVDTPDDPKDFISALDQACDSQTRILACSWVDYATGVRRDPERLADVAHRHKALLVLDVIQGFGVLPLDFGAQQIDVLVADGRKWLLGPEGAGLLVVRRDKQDLFEITRPGWASTTSPLDFGAAQLMLSETATRFESGMHNTFGLSGLHASLRLLRDITPAARAERLLSVRGEFEKAGRLAGLECPAWPEPAQSGILTFRHPRLESAAVIRQLHSQNITVSLKNDHIRVSPHLYNDADDAQQFADAVSRLTIRHPA